MWFAQVEAQFNTHGIMVQKTKFNHVVALLSPEIAINVRDLIVVPSTENPFHTLKAQLIKRIAASEQ